MKLAFTGGGTLGHVLPALAVWDAVRSLDSSAEAFYIGGRGERERKAVEDRGLRCFSISTGKLRRYFSLRNFTDIFRIIMGFFQALSILRRERPQVLFSKGGYVSVPVVLAARMLGIRTVSHESDLTLGLANRINARFSHIVCLGFDSSLVDGRKYIHTGNPLRQDIRRLVGLKGEEEEGLILVLGGSMGARQVNALVESSLDALCPPFHIVHQCGRGSGQGPVHPGYERYEYIDSQLPDLMSRAQLVVSRAGAGAIGEIEALGKASLLIPLASASRGDQVENAAWMEERGAAEVLHEGEDFVAKVRQLMLDDSRRRKLARRARELCVPDAASLIAGLLVQKRTAGRGQ